MTGKRKQENKEVIVRESIEDMIATVRDHRVIMAANVLRSPQAVEMSVFVVRAFVKMHERFGLLHRVRLDNDKQAVPVQGAAQRLQLTREIGVAAMSG